MHDAVLWFTCLPRTYKLILKIFEYSKDFPKDYKFTLGQDMKRDALQLVRSIYRAYKSALKKEHLEKVYSRFCAGKVSVEMKINEPLTRVLQKKGWT